MKKIKENKKLLVILGSILGIILLIIGLVIGGINIANSKDYKEIKNKYQEVLGESIDLGLVHNKEEIEQAKKDFDKQVEKYQKEIDSKVKGLSFDIKEFIKINKIEIPNVLKQQINLLNTATIVDNVKTISKYDNYKPSKTNDAIKKEVKDIDTKASEAYDLIIKEVSIKFTVTKEDITKFLKDLDFKKTLTKAQIKTLKTLSTVDFSDEFIKQIETIKNDLKKIVDNIKKEVKTIQDKEKANKEAEAAKAKAQPSGNGASPQGKYTGGGSTSNTSSMNDWCKQHYGSQGWTQWYPSKEMCSYPKANKVGYDRTMAQQIFVEVNKHRAEVGVGQLTYNSSKQSCADKEAETFYKTQVPHPMVCGTGGNAIYIVGVGKTAKEYVSMWAGSPKHEANQTDKNHTSVAISVYYSPKGDVYIEAMYY